VTVNPLTPRAERLSFTSSNLKGLMIASTFFMVVAPFLEDHDLSLLIVPLRVREDNPCLQAKRFALFLRHDAGTKLQRHIGTKKGTKGYDGMFFLLCAFAPLSLKVCP
jgi:hypothetical protein